MARIVVVGGGFAGLSAATRLAKSHHEVTLLEASPRLGGALNGIEIDGAGWNLYAQSVTAPGVFRDLFRKSGRTMQQSLDLVSIPDPRRHIFADHSVLDLPHGHRGDQVNAITQLCGFDTWSPWVDSLSEVWEILRRRSYDQVLTGPAAFSRADRKVLRTRRMLSTFKRRAFADPRLRRLVLDPITHAGLDPATTPAMLSMWHYVERTFGRWRFDGDGPGLAAALTKRVAERKIDVRLSTAGRRLVRAADQHIRAIETDAETIDCDIVIWCNRTVPEGEPTTPAIPAIPASRTLLELEADPTELADETMIHTSPPIVAHRTAPGRWTIEHRSGQDVLQVLAREAGIDLRERVTRRYDLSPTDVSAHLDEGWTWDVGWRSMFARPGVAPAHGLFHAGAHAHPGPRLELIGMATSAISAAIGVAPRKR